MSTKTATVETLTAEVRVLMVGSRQVTLSVFAQLDEALFEDVEPFGRVRARDHDGLWVVGRRVADGELVKASPDIVSTYPVFRGETDVIDHWVAHWDQRHRTGNFAGSGTYVLAPGVTYENNGGWPKCDLAHDLATVWAAAKPEVDNMRMWVEAKRQVFAEAQRLPLIVLAGLR